MFCGPSLLYLGFSIIQIIIDIYKGLYNTTLIKFIVMVLFTVFLNILCKSGLTVVSWLIVFIPFISMTVITTLLLFVFGLDPSQGNLNYQIMNFNGNFSSTASGQWRVVYPNGTFELITLTNGQFYMLGQQFQLLNTSPVTFRWIDGTIHSVQNINNDGLISWVSNNENSEYGSIVWIPVNMQTGRSGDIADNIDPCPPNVTPQQFSTYYGGFCMTGTQLNQLRANSSGSFRVLYFDGTTEIITLNNGSYSSGGVTYTIVDTNPLTIVWPNGIVQTLDITNSNFIRWITNSGDSKFSTIIWEPINDGIVNTIPTTSGSGVTTPTSELIRPTNNPECYKCTDCTGIGKCGRWCNDNSTCYDLTTDTENNPINCTSWSSTRDQC